MSIVYVHTLLLLLLLLSYVIARLTEAIPTAIRVEVSLI